MFKGKLPMVFAGFCVGVGWPILGSLLSVLIGDTLQPFVPLVMLLLLLEVGLKLPFSQYLHLLHTFTLRHSELIQKDGTLLCMGSFLSTRLS